LHAIEQPEGGGIEEAGVGAALGRGGGAPDLVGTQRGRRDVLVAVNRNIDAVECGHQLVGSAVRGSEILVQYPGDINAFRTRFLQRRRPVTTATA